MKKLKVGDMVYLVSTRHTGKVFDANYSEVLKVGRKYFYLEGTYNDSRFNIDTWREDTEYTSSYSLYESKEVYEDELEKSKLSTNIRDILSGWNFKNKYTLEDLRKVHEILSKND